MKQLVKRILKRYFSGLYKLIKGMLFLYRKDSYLNITGYSLSMIEEKPLDCYGNPIPWMNYGVVDFLKDRLTKKMSLFEYGSGYSTIFFSKYCKDVLAIEHEQIWYEKMNTLIPDNCTVKYYNRTERKEGYAKYIVNQSKKYHVIIVDGRDRVDCVREGLKMLKKDGVLILDDSARERYVEAFKLLERQGFKRLTFCGLKSGGIGADCTTVFYKNENCFKI